MRRPPPEYRKFWVDIGLPLLGFSLVIAALLVWSWILGAMVADQSLPPADPKPISQLIPPCAVNGQLEQCT